MFHEYVPDDIVDSIANDPLFAVAVVASVAVTYALFYEGLLYKIGQDSSLWQMVRRALPYVDEEARAAGFYTSYELGEEEYVGVMTDSEVSSVRVKLEEAGFIRNPLAAHKEFLGQREVLSMAHYGIHGDKIEDMSKPMRFLVMLLIPRQVHVMVFPRPGETGYMLAAHEEFSPYNPFLAFWHLRSKGVDIEEGVSFVGDYLAGYPSFEERELEVYE